MDSRILLRNILQRFKDQGYVQVEGYNKFGYIRETNNSVFVTRENGKDTLVPFQKILVGMEAYQSNPELYNDTPTSLRQFGITHVTSPVWAMLHLLEQHDY